MEAPKSEMHATPENPASFGYGEKEQTRMTKVATIFLSGIRPSELVSERAGMK